MTNVAVSINRTCRVANETWFGGIEVLDVELCEFINQEISAATEEEVNIGDFSADQLKALVLTADVDMAAQFIGDRYAIVLGAAGDVDYAVPADLTDVIHVGDFIRVEGASNDNGVYRVQAHVAGNITLENGKVLIDIDDGTLVKVMSTQLFNDSFTVATATAATGVITYVGDITSFIKAGDWIYIHSSTGNDGLWLVDTIAYAAPDTTITLDPALLPDNTNDGEFQRFNPAIMLVADVPFEWSKESGFNNPLLNQVFNYDTEDRSVSRIMVNNAGAEDGTIRGRRAMDSIP